MSDVIKELILSICPGQTVVIGRKDIEDNFVDVVEGRGFYMFDRDKQVVKQLEMVKLTECTCHIKCHADKSIGQSYQDKEWWFK